MTDEYSVLAEFVRHPNYTLRELAVVLGWESPDTGKTDPARVHHCLVSLSLSGLVRHRGDWKGWAVTERGRELVKQIKELP